MIKVPESKCLACGEKLNAATDATLFADTEPTPGCLTICIHCGHLMAFDDDLKFRPLTDAEMQEAAGHPDVLGAQALRVEALQYQRSQKRKH
jgi:hypothetical protein